MTTSAARQQQQVELAESSAVGREEDWKRALSGAMSRWLASGEEASDGADADGGVEESVCKERRVTERRAYRDSYGRSRRLGRTATRWEAEEGQLVPPN
ncbi:hypothetical protein Q1695_004760 [Nippostrongylus brasiliensis]|nr:hypothetical protein Q1695_004760 [Nippostrongylus brasiliensis]